MDDREDGHAGSASRAAGFAGSSGWAPILAVSVAALFLQLCLIRWLGTEVALLSFLQNLVLVTSFLGLGLGSLTCHRPFALRATLIPFLMLAAALTLPPLRRGMFELNEVLRFFTQPAPWARLPTRDGLPIVGLLLVMYAVLGTIMLAFEPLGRYLGQLLQRDPHPIRAYSVNIAASALGIWLFALLGTLSQPPSVWLLVGACLLATVAIASRQTTPANVLLLLALVPLALAADRDPTALEIVWSPYQKLTLTKPTPNQGWAGIGDYIIWTNTGIAYQGMLDLRPPRIATNPGHLPVGLSQYDVPARLAAGAKTALIVGAGSGNDAAGLLRQGLGNITAVDIDPAIMELGRQFHPEKPYARNVRMVVDDARSFFASTRERFDLIVFGLLDSQSSTGAVMTARLDNYVYTLESLQKARSLLNPGGVLVLTFEPTLHPVIPERIWLTLTQVFAHGPLWFRIPPTLSGWGGLMFVASDDPASLQRRIAADPDLARQVATWQRQYRIPFTGQVAVCTDDWPYLYAPGRAYPALYYSLAGLPFLVLLRLGWRNVAALGSAWSRTHGHFFFLGAAFLLLETHNINRAAVTLGNTWVVNVVIISAVLFFILLANLAVSFVPRLPLLPVYAGLCSVCLGLYVVDLSWFGALPWAPRSAAVGAVTCLPMFFSGVVFARSFAAVTDRDQALGANLLGALVGGLLQTMTFVTGIRALLLVVAALYAAALITRPRLLLHPPGA